MEAIVESSLSASQVETQTDPEIPEPVPPKPEHQSSGVQTDPEVVGPKPDMWNFGTQTEEL